MALLNGYYYFTMQELFESLTNLNESDYFEKVNLHIHSKFSDGTLEPQDIIKQAIIKGLQIISITDHNSVDAYENIDYENLSGLKIITGVEFDCWHKSNFLHILGYGIDTKHAKIQKLCATKPVETKLDLVRFFNKRKAKDVINAIKEAGGISVIAHPACCWNINIKKMIEELKFFGLEGVETYYPYLRHRGIVKFHTIKEIINIAEELELVKTGGTDSHGAEI